MNYKNTYQQLGGNEIENAIDFFDGNYSSYSRDIQKIDTDLLNFIRSNCGKKFLDIGGGNGSFAISLLKIFPDLDVTIVDPSENFINIIHEEKMNKIIGYLPDKLNTEESFDFISCNWLFHHIVGSDICNSKNLLIDSIYSIKSHLYRPGYLIVNEIYYEGYIYKTLPRTAIFYMLRLQNKLGIKIPLKYFLNNLLVCFYTRNELKQLLKECGFEIVFSKETSWKVPSLFKFALVKKLENILICAKNE